MDMTEAGRFDAVYNAYYTADRAKIFQYSKGYFVVELVLCTLSDDVVFDGSAESLRGVRLGLVYNYANSDEIDGADFLDKHYTTNDRLNLRKLVEKRVDAVIIGRKQAEYLIATDLIIKAKKSDIRTLSPFVARRNLHLMFSKSVPGWQKKAERFDVGLAAIQEDGALEIIIERWICLQNGTTSD